MTDYLRIRNLPCRTQYICDGERTAFDFIFAVFEPNDIEVWIDGAAVSQGFAVQGVRETDGGRVVFQAPPAAGSRLTLQRRLIIARETDFQHGGILRSDALNDELDRIIAMLQQLDADTSRAVRLRVSDDAAELRLPVKASRAGQVLAFDIDGNLTTLAAQLSASAGRPDLDAIPEGLVNKHFTAAQKQKLADLPLAANNAIPPQVTPAEKQAASETALRSFSPQDVGDMARINAVAGSVSSIFGRVGAITAAAGDYRCDQITDAGGKVMMLAAERNKLAQLRSVCDFGAVGNGIADDTAAINAAIAAMPATGGRLYFPAGIYRIGGTVTLSRSGIYYGDGQATVIRSTSASADAFAVNAEQVVITDMSWDSAVPRTGGAYVAVYGSRFRLQRFLMSGAYIGVHLFPNHNGATATIAEGQIFNTVAGAGVCILVNGGFDVSIFDILVDNAAGANCFAGIQINETGDVEISRGQIIHCNYGLLVQALPGKVIASVWANNSFFDNCGVGVRLYADGGAIIRSLFDQCWFSSASSFGCALLTNRSGHIDGVDINTCHVFLNAVDGVNIADAGVRNVRITNGSFAQNGASGIAVIGASEFAVIGARIGNTHGLSGNCYAIFIGNVLSSNYTLVNNDVRGNTTGAIIDAGSGAKIVTGNLGA